MLFVRQCCIFIMTRERTLPYFCRYKLISIRTRTHHNPNEQTPPPPPQHEADATQLHSALNILESDSIVSLKPPASQGTQPQPSQNHKGRAGTLDRRRVCVYKRLSSVAQNDRRKPTTRWTTNAWVDLCCRRNSDSPSDITKTQAHKGTRESTHTHTHTHTGAQGHTGSRPGGHSG